MIIGFRASPIRGLLALLGLSVLTACWMDDDGPTAPSLVEEETRSVGLEMALVCEADRSAGTVACRTPETSLPAGGSGLIVGGQGELVELRSTNVHYDAGQQLFQTDVSVKNLMMQALGTIDGQTVSSLGVRIFYHRQPVATVGEGEITVLDVDGYDIFAASEQPYYQYSQLLRTGEESAARTWKWRVPDTVTAFEFAVFVFAPVQYPHGWVEIDREHLLLSPDQTEYGLTATARDAFGQPIPGDEVVWESSNPSVATIDSDGNVTPVGFGTAKFTASVEGRGDMPTASATVAVVNESLVAGAVRLQNKNGGSRIVAPLGSGLDQAIEAGEETTVEGWFRGEFLRDETLFAKGWTDPGSGGSVGFAFTIMSGGFVRAEYQTPSGVHDIFHIEPLEGGRWYHVALVLAGTEMRLYLDGDLVDGSPLGMPTTLPDRFQLGCNHWTEHDGCAEPFNGDLDDFRVWSTALDGAMIADWMDRPVTSSHPAFDQLLAYWPFDDGEGREVIDVSGRGVHATVEGASPVWIPRANRLDVTPSTHFFGAAGQTLQLVVETESAFGDPLTPTFSSSDPAVATVDANGLVTSGEGDGTSRITVSAPGAPDVVVLVQKGPVYVKADATGANNGTSWEDAFTDLQDALNGPGGEIWVAKGRYRTAAVDDSSAVFRMRSGQAIYGGFDGTESSRDERRWWENETLLTGEFIGAGWRRQVVVAEDVDSTGILDGFTVTGAWATGEAAAIVVYGGAPTFRNLKIAENRNGPGAASGIYLIGGAPTFYNVAITNNYGEGLIATNGAKPVLTNVTILGSMGPTSVVSRDLGTHVTLRNAIVWYSSRNFNQTVVRNEDGGFVTIDHAFVESGCPMGGECNEVHALYPEFVNHSAMDARLTTHSPAINRGRSDFIPSDAGTLDLAGNPRIYGDAVDLGAYEVQSEPSWSPAVTFSLPSYDFGYFFRGQADWRRTSVTNSGSGYLLISAVEMLGEDAEHFGVEEETCVGEALSPGESCYIDFSFKPKDAGEFVAQLRVMHNGTDGYSDAEIRGQARTNVIYVNHAATGANNGSSWEDAYTDLATAIDAASNIGVEGAEFWVAQGTYRPTTGADRNASFHVYMDMALYGGFVGTETSRDQRRWWENETILSGDIGIPGDDSDNSYRILTLTSTTPKVLDGFIITGANNDRSGDSGRGGGIWCHQCQVDLKNVIVRDNRAQTGGGMAFVSSNLNINIINSLITGNESTGDGGALYVAQGMRPHLINTTVYANHAGGRGGAAYVDNEGFHTWIRAYNSIFWNNSAGSGMDEIHMRNTGYMSEVRNSIVASGCTGLATCTSTIAADPLFVDPFGPDGIAGTADDDLRLMPGSPAIGWGDSSYLPIADRTLDLIGQPRIEGTLDAGAIEHHSGAVGAQRRAPSVLNRPNNR